MLPEVLVLDEPTAALDPEGQSEVWQAIERLRRERAMTIVMVSQDAEQVSPASAEGVFTTAASDETDKSAEFTNFGKTVEGYAPGVGIVSTDAHVSVTGS